VADEGPIRVLEIAAPPTAAAGRLLADAGAWVVKLEPPSAGPTAPPDPRRRYHDADKLGLSLDLQTATGRDLLARLIPSFDIVVEGGRPGGLVEMGIGFHRLAQLNPRLVLVSITPFGQTGPYSGYVADDLVAFAMGGLMFLSGRPDLPPVVAPCEQAYMMAAVHAAFTALAAHWAARRSGRGEWADVSIVECLAAQENTITNFRGGDDFSRRMGSQHRTAVPGRIFACADGYVHIFVVHQDPQVWQRFLDWVQRPSEISDPEFADGRYRADHANVVIAATERFVRDRTRAELFRTGQALHLPITPVYSVGEVIADEHVRFLDVLEPVGSDDDRYLTLRPPIRRGAEPLPRTPAPATGAQTEAILRDLVGMTGEEFAALRVANVVQAL
jgi:crotonobetainyl-CoA:carnitine CoA-transferase CaiB-like acyl-CoA transferase